MYFKVSWDQDFSDLMMHLWAKYGREIFTQNGIGDQLDLNKFSKDFFNNNTTTADVSIDDNSNVNSKSIIDYDFEFKKPLQKYNSHYLLWKQLKKSYGLLEANTIIEKQISGEIYINDFTNCQAPYCFNFSTYDIALSGLPMADRIMVTKPKGLESFIRQMEQFIVDASNSTLGATGLADILIVASYYVDKIIYSGYDHKILIDDYGHATDNPVFTDRIKTYVSERFKSFIYTLNWKFRGNQCNCEQTQVLTPNGWKGIDDLKVNDDIYTWKDGNVQIEKTQKVNIYNYDGEMHHYTGKCVDNLVTPNHRIVYTRGKRWLINQSENLIDLSSDFSIPISGKNSFEDYPISDDLLELSVFILTDGSFDSQNNTSKRLKFFKTNKRWGQDRFKELCSNLGYMPHHYLDNNNGHPINIYTINTEDSVDIFTLCNGTKTKLPSFFKNLSARQAKIVLDTWEKLDGYSKRHLLQCDTEEVANSIQHLCFLAGEGSIKRYEEKGCGVTTYIQRIFHKTKTVTNKEKVYYKGRVWCPTTDTGIIICKRNGKVFITGNSPFTNISIYDDFFLKDLVKDYIFEDGKSPDINTVKNVQKIFIEAMNSELKRTDLTFPVTTSCFYVKEGEIQDKEFLSYIAEQNLDFGFINMYYGDSSTLSSCCRLRSGRSNEYFNTFGAGSTKIGSLGVVTQNFPRLAYYAKETDTPKEVFLDYLQTAVRIVAKINHCKRNIIKNKIEIGALPLYTLGYMDLSKQYSTFGVNGLNEALDILGYDITSKEGEDFVIEILDIINTENDKMSKRFKSPHNVEQTPSESSAVKLAKRDRILKYQDKYQLYSNQFIPLTAKADMLDRLRLQGKFDSHFSGGAIAHINIGEKIKKKETLINLMEYAAKCGVVYWAVNYALHRCIKNHVFIDGTVCPICGKEIDHTTTRVVGFFTNVDNWNEVRRTVDWKNRQFYTGIES